MLSKIRRLTPFLSPKFDSPRSLEEHEEKDSCISWFKKTATKEHKERKENHFAKNIRVYSMRLFVIGVFCACWGSWADWKVRLTYNVEQAFQPAHLHQRVRHQEAQGKIILLQIILLKNNHKEAQEAQRKIKKGSADES